MSCLTTYLTLGVLVTLTGFTGLRARHRDPTGWRLPLALALGSLLWPITVLTLWYERQRAAWEEAQPSRAAWTNPPGRPVRYHPHRRVTVSVRYSPRQAFNIGSVTLLYDPRPRLDAPLLLHPWGCTLHGLAGTLHVLWPARPIRRTRLTRESGFTLVEILIVIAVIGILAAVLTGNFRGARAASERKLAQAYLDTCFSTAEQRRDLLTNTVTLPASCEALGLPRPAHVTGAAITLSGNTYTITVTAPTGVGTRSLPRSLMP